MSKLPFAIEKKLQDAIEAASCRNASFGSGKVTYQGRDIPLDDFIKERIRVHHDTWIREPLKSVLDWSDGLRDADGYLK